MRYHIKRLAREGAIVLEPDGRRDVRCFPVSIPAKYRRWLAILLDDVTRRVMADLERRPATSREVADRLGVSRSAARRRLERLHEGGMVAKTGVLRPRYAPKPEAAAWLREREGAEGGVDEGEGGGGPLAP